MEKSIEEMGYSVSLYNYLKRKGVNFVQDIPVKVNYAKLTKVMLVELLEEHGEFHRY